MDERAVELLICPHCGGELRENGGSLICSKGHTANIARQGYVSLLGRDSGTHTADSPGMVAARERFFAAGHFQPLVEALVAEATALPVRMPETMSRQAGSTAGEEANGRAVVDFGCGTGHFLAPVLDALNGWIGIGIDNSKFAARRAARSHERASAIVADIWDAVPVEDGAAELLLNVFSPRNGPEMERILAPGGRLLVVTPQAGHLGELIDRFGMVSVDADKERRLERTLGRLAEGARMRDLEWTMTLTPEAIRDLVAMGPSAGRMDPAASEAALSAQAEMTAVTAAVTITTTSSQESQ